MRKKRKSSTENRNIRKSSKSKTRSKSKSNASKSKLLDPPPNPTKPMQPQRSSTSETTKQSEGNIHIKSLKELRTLQWSRTSSVNTSFRSRTKSVVEGCDIIIVPYNPKVADLSCSVFYKHKIEHQSDIILLLQSTQKKTTNNLYSYDKETKFDKLRKKIESLVLDPMPS